jgi:hypothetical protein
MSAPNLDDLIAERQVLVNLLRKALYLEQDLRVLDHDREAKCVRRGVIAPLVAKIKPFNEQLQRWVDTGDEGVRDDRFGV